MTGKGPRGLVEMGRHAIGKMIGCHISPQLKRQRGRQMVLLFLFLPLY
jgi:hypothetical protein